MKFYDPVLKWTSPSWASFSVICDGLRSARMANPGLTASKGLATDPNAIADEVDNFIAAHCQQMGWNDFITGSGGSSAPFPVAQHQPRPSLAQQGRNVAVGVETTLEWIASGAEAVPQEQSTSRAEVCTKCPLNTKGGWLSLFTVPAQKAIQAALNRKTEFKLTTPFDDQLGCCEACSCPMQLKVHVPFEKFFPKMTQPAKDGLDPNCWIVAESKK